MISLHNLAPKPGSVHRKKRLGTGQGSGHGQTSTKGQKGQNATAGGSKRDGFEGGQMPLLRRIPKSGFSNRRFRVVYEWTNVSILDKHFENGAEVTPAALVGRKLIKKGDLVKVLGDGDIKKKLTVRAHAFSGSAREKIEKAGGKAELLAEVKRENKTNK
ncbi:MAG: 50S ribosomal protein L15 [Elusimicrobia bacterium GWA2_56_46]|nr:MAG: 50S ribosomal protein L15 [Elusimicrobia bacterium GWA2_56_46]OGR55007.1 MAG: 50S ribosomal protein L15 [Elusimicrobia bacterium GWC2_56_31]HBB67141.1 50S ribosomal protein L15 [Elusimicrobiota bacterium]HBW23983.1 50S ribosomal protein L15 [Elusimicrobiota bacterium]